MNTSSIAEQSETLRYAYGDTVLGIVAIAESEKGVAALFLGDSREKLRRDLKEAFSQADFVLDQSGLAESVRKAVGLVNSPYKVADLRLDLRGSPLELSVWRALREVPSGETRTYGAIAKTLSITATAQEVGAACAANRIAVAIPCHRVVKADGSISGYRWGVQRKRRLINMEGVA